MSKLIKDIMDALNAAQKNKTEPYDRQGEVKRIEGKIAWVRLEGSDLETPVQMTIACDVGDTVQARIGGGSAWLTGNLTAPPTDDKKANQAISMATTVIQQVKEEVDEALEDLDSGGVDDVKIQYCLSNSASSFIQYGSWSNTPPEFVSGKYYWTRTVIVDDDGNVTYGTPQYSQDTQLSVETDIAFESNNNHFWHDSSGAYVTTANKNYSSGYATRITTNGILQSYGGNLLSGWTSSGIAFYAGDGTTASNSTKTAEFGTAGINLYSNGTSVASFGSTARIGAVANDTYNISVESDGIYFRENTTPNCIIRATNTGAVSILGREMLTLKTSEVGGAYVRIGQGSMLVQIGGDVDATGGLTVQNHSSAIGTVKDAYLSSSMSISANTGTALCSISLEAGTWVVSCGARFPANSSGSRRANLSTTSGYTSLDVQLDASSVMMQFNFTKIVTPTSTTTYYLNAYSTTALTMPSGSAGVGNFISAVRIA